MRLKALTVIACAALLTACAEGSTVPSATSASQSESVKSTYPQEGSKLELVASYDRDESRIKGTDSNIVTVKCRFEQSVSLPMTLGDGGMNYELVSGEDLFRDFVNGKTDTLTVEYIYSKTNASIDTLEIKRTGTDSYSLSDNEIKAAYAAGAEELANAKAECIKAVHYNGHTDYYICDKATTDMDVKNREASSSSNTVRGLFSIPE